MKQTSLFKAILNNMDDGVYYVDLERRISLWNHAAEKITGYTSQEMVGHFCHDNLLCHIDLEGHPLCTVGCPLYASMGDGTPRQAEVLLRHKNGYRVPVTVKAVPVYSGDVVVGAVEIFRTKSAVIYEDRFVDAIAEKAMSDPLTGLPNRTYLESYLEYKLQQFARFGNPFCVLFADIDNFNLFNNHFGHNTGDAILQSIAQNISANLHGTEKMGRWGGEEFLGIFDLHDDAEPYAIAERIRSLFAHSGATYNGTHLAVTASVGLSVVKANDTAESIVARADTLMYKSKVRGKNCVTLDIAPPDGLAATLDGDEKNE
ncbi:sensor domain-containing diguanylate cyclase [Ruminococcaceae bacterium OttesenSCG-928-A16]|nr:sensor domain-containing diguanylate cyclase [Ruminococcaceae bacterium OttesenSCG-928-A16]